MLSDLVVRAIPLAIVDLETTGFLAGGDKIVEIGIVRVEPGQPARVVLDTLVDPHRPMAATEIHGIRDEDVSGAPSFGELAGNVVEALEGAVMAAYNIYFDARFLATELSPVGVTVLPPYLCLMYMRCLLDLGKKCTLDDACKALGVSHTVGHHAATDALASAKLWQAYVAILDERGIRTFGELARARTYKFLSTFSSPLFVTGAAGHFSHCQRLKPRETRTLPTPVPGTQSPRVGQLAEYWDSLMAALSDLDVSQPEISYLREKQASLSLNPEDIRWMHGRAFSSVLGSLGQDKAITLQEARVIWSIASALRELGWAPGDNPDPGPLPITPR